MGYVILGGSIVPESLVDKAAVRGISVLRSCGSTEHPTISCGVLSDSRQQLRATDGKPLPGVEVSLRLGDGSAAPAGVEGEVYSRGPDRSAGYLDGAEKVGAFDSDGWLASGDLGTLDVAGDLAITGRARDLIIRNGINIRGRGRECTVWMCPGG